MLLRPIREEEQDLYNQIVRHPLQSWAWGEFRKKTGLAVERIGIFDNGKIQQAFQLTFHPIPVLGGQIGYLPKGFSPDLEQISALKELAKKYQATLIKLEPQVIAESDEGQKAKKLLTENNAVKGRPLFTRYNFLLDLTPTEAQLFANLKSKTRYNINLSYKKGVRIFEDSSQQGLQIYLDILAETTKRQAFYAHSPKYFQDMWETLKDTGMMRIFHAQYENTVLVSWIMFVFNGVLYYPYGASRDLHREVMASNLMMWEMIKFGLSQNCHQLDMWGALGPNPDKKHPWYGFHRFKAGYGGELVEYLGTYDLITAPLPYKVFRVAENLRWKTLRLKAKLGI